MNGNQVPAERSSPRSFQKSQSTGADDAGTRAPFSSGNESGGGSWRAVREARQDVNTRPVTKPTQRRSRQTLDRLVDALETLLETRRFEDITVAEILSEAQASRSSMYAFADGKESLLDELHRRMIQGAPQQVGIMASELVRRSVAPEEFLGRAIKALMEARHRNPNVNRAIRQSEHAALRERARETETEVIGAIRNGLIELLPNHDPKIIEFRVRFASGLFVSALRDRLDHPGSEFIGFDLSESDTVGAMTEMALIYLGVVPAQDPTGAKVAAPRGPS